MVNPLWKSLAVPYKIKHTPRDLTIPFLGIYRDEVSTGFVHHLPKLETIQIAFNLGTSTQTVVQPNLRHEKRWTTAHAATRAAFQCAVTGFLGLTPTAVLRQVWHSRGSCPRHCRKCTGVPNADPLHASSTSPPSPPDCDNQNCHRTLPNVPCGANTPQPRTTALH